MGLHDDAPATARWEGGTRVVASHANGTQVPTDMPAELGGTGDQVTPGWLFRAGARLVRGDDASRWPRPPQGIELTTLEVRASSRSDTRGLLGMADADGEPVCAGPRDVQLHVRIAAPGVAPRSRCARWSKTAAAARRSRTPCRTRCRWRCASTSSAD